MAQQKLCSKSIRAVPIKLTWVGFLTGLLVGFLTGLLVGFCARESRNSCQQQFEHMRSAHVTYRGPADPQPSDQRRQHSLADSSSVVEQQQQKCP